MKYTDLLLLDIKHIDDEQHKILTGHTNQNILDLARYLSDINKPVWIRHVLVPERSDNDEYLKKLDAFIQTLSNVEKVEVLPYHTLGEYKWKELGMEYPLEGIELRQKSGSAMRMNCFIQENKKEIAHHPPEMMSDTFMHYSVSTNASFPSPHSWT